MRTKAFNAAELFIWAIWLGGLWVMALLIAPALFKWLPRHEAGIVAGRLFFVFAWMSLIVPGVLWGLSTLNQFSHSRWTIVALISVVVLAAIGLFGLQPHMNALRTLMQNADEAGQAALRIQFGRLHAVSSVVFAVQMLLGLWWGWKRFVWGVQPS